MEKFNLESMRSWLITKGFRARVLAFKSTKKHGPRIVVKMDNPMELQLAATYFAKNVPPMFDLHFHRLTWWDKWMIKGYLVKLEVL